MTHELRTRISGSGYLQFWDERAGCWEYVHRRVIEKKLGGPIPAGMVVHHINGNKLDNRPANLVAVEANVHRRIHTELQGVCFRCGHSGHQWRKCWARRTFSGASIRLG